MNGREPTAKAARARLEWSWIYVGLAILMLCRLAGSPSLLSASEMSAKHRTQEVERRIDEVPGSARDLARLQRAAAYEDATDDVWIVVSRLGFEQPPHCRVGGRNGVITTPVEHLLVSTGLGRGPPIG